MDCGTPCILTSKILILNCFARIFRRRRGNLAGLQVDYHKTVNVKHCTDDGDTLKSVYHLLPSQPECGAYDSLTRALSNSPALCKTYLRFFYKNGSVSDLLVEGTSGFVHSLKPQEVNLP